jgi:hypothetical protein
MAKYFTLIPKRKEKQKSYNKHMKVIHTPQAEFSPTDSEAGFVFSELMVQ